MLGTIIGEFKQDAVTARAMLSALEEVPEVQGHAGSLGFSDIRLRKYDGPVSTDRFSVHCRNATLREVLNEIARRHGGAVWSYREYDCGGEKCLQLNLLFG